MEDKSATIIDHLDELRRRLIYSAVAFFVFLGIGFYFVNDIYDYLTKAAQPAELIILGPSDVIFVYFMIAVVIAMALLIPFVVIQIWLFVKPALKARERRAALRYFPAVFILFAVGIAFGYYVVFPIIYDFLSQLGDAQMETTYEATRYFKFLLHMTLPFGVLFEMPVVMMFMTSIGILNPYVLTRSRKYVYFVLIIVGVIISPPTFVSDFVTYFPLLILFEISASLSKIIYRRKQKRVLADDDDEIEELVAAE